MTIPESASSSPTTRADENAIEIKLQEFEQLFNTIDPSPFHEKDLDHDLEGFIESWAKEYPLHEPLRLESEHLTERSSDRRTAVRSTFEMTSILSLRAMRALVRRRSSCSR
jgi:hypothetical protein